MPYIHPTAIVDPTAQLGSDVHVGPFAIIEPGVVVGDGCRLEARAVIKSRTVLGSGNEVGEGAVLGGAAQHLQRQDPGGRLILGDNNRIRENATLHRGYANEAVTTVGNNNLIMVGAHIAHDCKVGNHVVLVNNVMLGGHVQIEDRAYIGGGVGVHQFCRVGRFVMIGAQSRITQDVPHYVLVEGAQAQIIGLNQIGLRRNGFTADDMLQLKQAYRVIYRQGLRWSEVLEHLARDFTAGPAALYHDFLKSGKRGFVQERRISRKAMLKIVDPAAPDEIGEEKPSRKSDAA
ncbi:MAG: acyl-ACP--UDP-N-acetylglucosamine O-acyltransferase [Planctomycetales bacterium]|nr:acyl-ACP--UDP-N-acetylglucosamine O-acyltransferase [Planctomycetales bacterium]